MVHPYEFQSESSKKSNSRLYPSFFIVDHEMNWGFGEPGNIGRFSEIVKVRSSATMKISMLCG